MGKTASRKADLFFDAWLILLGALGLFFGFPNPLAQVPLLLLLCPFSLYLLAARNPKGKAAFLRGWLLGLAGQSLALYWLTVPMIEVGQLPLFLAVPALMLLTAYLSLYYGLTALAMHLAAKWFEGSGRGSLSGFLAPITGGLAFAAGELFCGRLFSGFPWLNLASGFVPWPEWVQGASLVGSYGMSALFAAAASFAACAALKRGVKERLPSAGACLAVLVIIWGFGRYRLSLPPLPDAGSTTVRFIAVQGNIDQNRKWTPAYQAATVDHYIALTQKGLREAGRIKANGPRPAMTMALWPETAMPFYFETHTALADKIRNFALQQDAAIGFGTLHRVLTPARIILTNRFLLLNPRGDIVGHYDKEHLVPFGEYIPGPLDFAFLHNILQGMYFSPGLALEPLFLSVKDPLADAPRPPLVNGKPQVLNGQSQAFAPSLAAGVLICYEAIFPELAQKRVKSGADILINISNDGWFGKTSAPAQHLNLAAMRAVEQNRYLVRGTNTGYTALISPRGIIEKKGGLYLDEVFVFDARTLTGLTPFHHIFYFIQFFLAFCPFVLLSIGRIRYRRLNRRNNME